MSSDIYIIKESISATRTILGSSFPAELIFSVLGLFIALIFSVYMTALDVYGKNRISQRNHFWFRIILISVFGSLISFFLIIFILELFGSVNSEKESFISNAEFGRYLYIILFVLAGAIFFAYVGRKQLGNFRKYGIPIILLATIIIFALALKWDANQNTLFFTIILLGIFFIPFLINKREWYISKPQYVFLICITLTIFTLITAFSIAVTPFMIYFTSVVLPLMYFYPLKILLKRNKSNFSGMNYDLSDLE